VADAPYRERPTVAPGVTVWRRAVAGVAGRVRILPDGCLDLIWIDGRLLIAGPDTTARVVALGPGAAAAGLRFAPGVGPAVLGIPANELVDAQPFLDEVWPSARAMRLAARVEADPEPATGLESALVRELGALPASGGETAAMTRVACALGAGGTVSGVAAAAGFSSRQLQRRSHAAFGYGPKHLARILRLQRALAAARRGTSLARVAADCGYADQAHLSRDVRDLAGLPLRELLA
jgi:AraC-like DNA-binding protein